MDVNVYGYFAFGCRLAVGGAGCRFQFESEFKLEFGSWALVWGMGLQMFMFAR